MNGAWQHKEEDQSQPWNSTLKGNLCPPHPSYCNPNTVTVKGVILHWGGGTQSRRCRAACKHTHNALQFINIVLHPNYCAFTQPSLLRPQSPFHVVQLRFTFCCSDQVIGSGNEAQTVYLSTRRLPRTNHVGYRQCCHMTCTGCAWVKQASMKHIALKYIVFIWKQQTNKQNITYKNN